MTTSTPDTSPISISPTSVTKPTPLANRNRGGQTSATEYKTRPGANITSSKDPFPMRGQRIIRGMNVALMVMLIMAALGQAIALCVMLEGRSMIVTPGAVRTGTVGGVDFAVSNEDMRNVAMRVVVTMETYTPSDYDRVIGRIRPWVLPNTLTVLAADHAKKREPVMRFFRASTAMPIAHLIGEAQQGLYSVVVRYNRVEHTHASSGGIEVRPRIKPRVAMLHLIRGQRTDQNPEGLMVTGYYSDTEQAWLKAGRPVFW